MEPIAIVGIGCRFPGGVTSPADFWRLLAGGIDAIREIPPDRIDLERWFDPTPATPGRMATRWGGFLDDITGFDAAFFEISPREAERMDPQQRLLLECAWEAMEDAGIDPLSLDGSRTGVFVGQWLSDFENRLFTDPGEVDFLMTLGSGRYATSGRVSYAFGFRGPSLTLDTACSSSLAAVHLACQSIRNGESTAALAGGVNVILQPHISIAYSQSGMMASRGRCRFGDAAGDGYVRSEGAAVVMLKSLARAQADGDPVYAIIRGSAINNDGRSSGVMGRPSRLGQEELLRAAYAAAGVATSEVGYVEAHGTGTIVGDPIELAAIGAVMGASRTSGSRCLVGSVKTNIGHTEGAAGVAGLIKVALSLHHGAIPASLHHDASNPNVPWSELHLAVPTSLTAWPRRGRRVAGVSSFGIAGTNAHIVLEAVSTGDEPAWDDRSGRTVALLPLSAKSPQALRELGGRYRDLLKASERPVLRDICWTAATRRAALSHRAAFVAEDEAAMADSLERFASGEAATHEGTARDSSPAKIAFVFPGQGGQWVGMGRELLEREPVFRAALERCQEAARPHVDWSIIEQLAAARGTDGYLLDRIDVIQPVLVAIAIAYAELWKSFGVQPDAVVGHSMGEVAAAHVAGVLDLDDAMHLICRRSALMRRCSGRGAMALVEMSLDDLRRRIVGREAELAAAVSNSPRSSVISGDPEAVQQLLVELEHEQIFCRLVKVDVASHSPQMEPLVPELVTSLSGLDAKAARVPIYSTVLGRRAEGSELGAAYWGTNLRQPVLFADATKQLIADGVTVFIELGPHPVLLPSIEQTAQSLDHEVTTLACGRRDEPEQRELLGAVGGLWCAGGPVDWRVVLRPNGRAVRLPSYPWQREKHWIGAAGIQHARNGAGRSRHSLSEEQRAWLHALRWVEAPRLPVGSNGRRPRRTLLVAGSLAPDLSRSVDALVGEHGVVEVVETPSEAVDRLRSTPEGELVSLVLLASGLGDLPYDALALTQRLLRENLGARCRLTIVTAGAQAVGGHARARVDVDQATLWGMGRVIAEEHPEIWGGLIDLDPAVGVTAQLERLLTEVTGDRSEPQISLRDGERFALRLRPLHTDLGEGATTPWPDDAAWLITGGLGGIGLHMAKGMVAGGVRRLILMGRSALPPRSQWTSIASESREGRRIAAIRELEAAGAAVHLLVADVADAGDLERALKSYEDEAWPPIRGVLHAAGVLDTKLATQTERASLERVLAAKLRGARHLDRLLPDVERFVVISSISATLGSPGMASYAAANAGLDALAEDRRARGLHGLSVQAGAWLDTGMNSGDSAEAIMGQLTPMGIRGHTATEGVAVFDAVAGRTDSNVVVMPVDWSAFVAARRGRSLALYQDRVAEGALGGTGGTALGERLAAADVQERRRLLDPLVRETVGRVLKLPPTRIDPRKALGSMGLNSLMAMELRNRLESVLERPLSATLAWNYPTVEALVGFLSGAGDTPAAPERSNVAVEVEAVASMSDADAARLLRRKR